MDATRWARLAADLQAAGYDVRVDATPFPGGVSRSVCMRMAKGLVTIDDTWWSKNPDVWTGYQVTAEGLDSIVIGRPARSKKRSETVAAFRTAITKVA
jgi:hypothetical protein